MFNSKFALVKIEQLSRDYVLYMLNIFQSESKWAVLGPG